MAQSMADFVERAVLRLRQDPGFSRNRHYATFSSPEGKKALRIHRHLRSIERDLSRGWAGTVEVGPARVCLVLRSRSDRRVAYLTPGEFRILCSNPAVRAALGAQTAES
jgi:hypothetical protein